MTRVIIYSTALVAFLAGEIINSCNTNYTDNCSNCNDHCLDLHTKLDKLVGSLLYGQFFENNRPAQELLVGGQLMSPLPTI